MKRVSVQVFHDLNPTFGFSRPGDPPPEYELVATYVREVDTDATRWLGDLLDAAFRDTNSIDCPWTHNPKVGPVRERIRSTSVGDIVQIDQTRFLCDRFGWRALEKNAAG